MVIIKQIEIMATDITLSKIAKATDCKTKSNCDKAIQEVKNTLNYKYWESGISMYVDKAYLRRIESLEKRKLKLKN